MYTKSFLILALFTASLLTAWGDVEKPEVKLELRLVVDQSNGETRNFALKSGDEAKKDEILITAKGLEFNAEDIRSASVVKVTTQTTDSIGAVSSKTNPQMAISMTKAAGERIKIWTRAHLGQRAAMVVDGQILMAPTIQAPFGSDFSISGKFSTEEMETIIKKIRRAAKK